MGCVPVAHVAAMPKEWRARGYGDRSRGTSGEIVIGMKGGERPQEREGHPEGARPKGTRRQRRVALAAAVIALLVMIGALWLRQVPERVPASVQSPTSESTTLAISVESNEGHCPSAVFKFTADLDLPGQAGEITYRWEGPNLELQSGGTAPPGISTDSTAVLRAGRPDPAVRYTFYVNGTVATRGDVVLHLLTPADRRSAPVHLEYRCP